MNPTAMSDDGARPRGAAIAVGVAAVLLAGLAMRAARQDPSVVDHFAGMAGFELRRRFAVQVFGTGAVLVLGLAALAWSSRVATKTAVILAVVLVGISIALVSWMSAAPIRIYH